MLTNKIIKIIKIFHQVSKWSNTWFIQHHCAGFSMIPWIWASEMFRFWINDIIFKGIMPKWSQMPLLVRFVNSWISKSYHNYVYIIYIIMISPGVMAWCSFRIFFSVPSRFPTAPLPMGIPWASHGHPMGIQETLIKWFSQLPLTVPWDKMDKVQTKNLWSP